MAALAIPLSPDRTSRACGVAAEKPRSHPLEFYLWVSFEGAGARWQSSVCCTFAGERLQRMLTPHLLTPFAVWQLTINLICKCISIIMSEAMNSICEHKPFSFCLMFLAFLDIIYGRNRTQIPEIDPPVSGNGPGTLCYAVFLNMLRSIFTNLTLISSRETSIAT